MKKLSGKRVNWATSWPQWLAGIAAAWFLGCAFVLAWQIEVDYFDSFNFIMQTRRLFDAELYRAVAYDTSRPRLVVMLLSFWHGPVKWITGSFPGITSIHVFMVLLTGAYLAAWAYFARKFFSLTTAAFLVLLLVTQPLLLHYSYPAMTDILSGIFLVVYLVCLWFVMAERDLKGTTLRSSLWLGVGGALLALTKHHLVPVLPATLVLFALLPWKKTASPRTVTTWKWYFNALFLYCLIVDLATRIFGKWGEGIGPHYKHIVRQALNSRAEPTTPWLYLDAITRPYGSFPWWVALLLIAFSFRQMRHSVESRSASEKKFIGVAALITVGFMLLTQLTPHREVRYILPFLPAILLPTAWAVALTLERLHKLPRRFRDVALFAIFGFALYFPFHGTSEEFRRFRSEPIYRSQVSGERAFWQGAQAMNCRQAYACDFAIQAPRPWEFPADDYYRRHDLGPHYIFYLGVKSSYGQCPTGKLLSDYGELVRFWTQTPVADACYFMPIPMVGGNVAMLAQTKCKPHAKTGAIVCEDRRVFPFTLGNASGS